MKGSWISNSLLPAAMARLSRSGCRRWWLVAGALSLLAGTIGTVTLAVPVRALAASSAFSLIPAAGQFFPVPAVKVVDTRDGTGGVSVAPLAANQTVTFPVINVGQVPDTVSDVYVAISAFSPSLAYLPTRMEPPCTSARRTRLRPALSLRSRRGRPILICGH